MIARVAATDDEIAAEIVTVTPEEADEGSADEAIDGDEK